MHDACEQTDEFKLIEAIAAALSEELGIAIEEQPGHQDPSEAGEVNRRSGSWPGPSCGRSPRRTRTCRRR
jgi:hypothetical protein